MSPSDLLRLIALVFAAVSFVVVGDTAGKLLTGAGVAPLLVAWSRFALGMLVVLPLCGLSRADWPGLRDWRVLLRSDWLPDSINWYS